MSADETILPLVQVYRELADRCQARGEAALRDRFLVLAADAALSAGQPDEAEKLRQRLLSRNRNHLIKPYHSFSQAVRAVDVKLYLEELRKSHPPEAARQLLERLRQGEASAPESTARPGFPQTSHDVDLGGDQDATWMASSGGAMSPPSPPPLNIEATADLDATAALEHLGMAPERLERTERGPPPRVPVPQPRP